MTSVIGLITIIVLVSLVLFLLLENAAQKRTIDLMQETIDEILEVNDHQAGRLKAHDEAIEMLRNRRD